MSNNLTVWSGSLVPLQSTQGDSASISVTLHLIPQGGGTVIIHSANFETIDDKVVADLTHTAPTVTANTIYDYYVSENFATEPAMIYPDPNKCDDGQCELPTYTVCPLEDS